MPSDRPAGTAGGDQPVSVEVSIKRGTLDDLHIIRGVGPAKPKNLNDVLDPVTTRSELSSSVLGVGSDFLAHWLG